MKSFVANSKKSFTKTSTPKKVDKDMSAFVIFLESEKYPDFWCIKNFVTNEWLPRVPKDHLPDELECNDLCAIEFRIITGANDFPIMFINKMGHLSTMLSLKEEA